MTAEPTLADALRAYADREVAPFHMPGHKRAPLWGQDLPYALDITEIDGFDDLHRPTGRLAEGMARAARLYGSEQAVYLVNGSTGGILAAVRAVARPGDTLLAARNCHRSVTHALELCRARPVWLTPPIDPATGVCGSLPPALLEEALRAHPDARLVVLTSPTYDGALSDLPTLVRLCHARGVPVLADEAHGAHLGFGPFPAGAVAAGADLVVQSLHKTLPALTQTGLLHRQGPRVDPAALTRQLDIFQTSSPSYPLMASIERCVDWLAREGPAALTALTDRLTAFDRAAAGWRMLRLPGHARPADPAVFFGWDPGKILIALRGVWLAGEPLTGPRLADRLRRDYAIEPEMATAETLLLMTGPGNTDEHFARLIRALGEIDAACERRADPVPLPALPPPESVLLPEEALLAPAADRPLTACAGATAAEYVWAYPPGIPLLAPGERVTPALLAHLDALQRRDIALRSTSGGLPRSLRVVTESRK